MDRKSITNAMANMINDYKGNNIKDVVILKLFKFSVVGLIR